MHVQSDTLLSANVFEHFWNRNMCLEILKLKTKVKLDLLIDIDMSLMVEEAIRWGICHFIFWYARANNKYMKDYNKNKEFSYMQYWDVNI